MVGNPCGVTEQHGDEDGRGHADRAEGQHGEIHGADDRPDEEVPSTRIHADDQVPRRIAWSTSIPATVDQSAAALAEAPWKRLVN
jgi:hypothetical protein